MFMHAYTCVYLRDLSIYRIINTCTRLISSNMAHIVLHITLIYTNASIIIALNIMMKHTHTL